MDGLLKEVSSVTLKKAHTQIGESNQKEGTHDKAGDKTKWNLILRNLISLFVFGFFFLRQGLSV